jgi:membrane fusion protein, multidrug efflux system
MLNDVEIEEHAPRVLIVRRTEPSEQDRQDEALGASGRSHSRAPAPREAPVAKTDRRRSEPNPEPEQREDHGHEGEAPRGGFLRRHPVRAAIGAASLLLAAGAGYVYWDYASHFESTDDAFIAARQFAIAPKVSGYVTEVPVTDNQHVVAGQVIARIDDRDYRTALEQAEAQVAAAQANINNMDAQITAQRAVVAQNEAQVDQSQASLVFSQQQAARYDQLAHTGYGSVQNAQQWDSQKLQQQATLKTTQAALVAAERQIDVLKAQRSTDEANLAQANAQLDQARLNLSYTIVTAAQPGRVVNLGGAVGQYATAGTNLSMFVPDDLWVTANFKESQLDQMRPGQKTTLVIDAYPERVFHGHVASVQPGSGTAFSLLPAENATGNYVKIVQRVPVKLVIDDLPTDVSLGPGMSVDPTVRVDSKASIFEQARARL